MRQSKLNILILARHSGVEETENYSGNWGDIGLASADPKRRQAATHSTTWRGFGRFVCWPRGCVIEVMCRNVRGRENFVRGGHARAGGFHAGFTLNELLVVVLLLTIILVVMPVTLGAKREQARRIKCTSSLKNVGLAYRIFETESEDISNGKAIDGSSNVESEFSAVGWPEAAGLETGDTADLEICVTVLEMHARR